jgi:hypothetical protein
MFIYLFIIIINERLRHQISKREVNPIVVATCSLILNKFYYWIWSIDLFEKWESNFEFRLSVFGMPKKYPKKAKKSKQDGDVTNKKD